MRYNRLDRQTKRHVITCNYNQHIRSPHPDRVLDWHDLIYIREGEWHIGQDDTAYTVGAGDVILLHSGHPHYGLAPCNDTVKTIYIEFSACETDTLLAEEVPEDTPEVPDDDCFRFPVVVHCQDAPDIRRLLENAVASFWSEDGPQRWKTAAWLDLLLCELSGIGLRTDTLVEQAKQQLQKTPRRFLSNAELAEQLHCSVRTLSERFKAATGDSVHAWQLRLKCQMADELLRREPHTTLKEIAANYGFCDEYHFGKCYKKVMGHSPKRAK